jgi:hypothetical protein
MTDAEMERHEQVERVRQQIMRLRELLTIMKQRQEAGERAYAALYTTLPEPMPPGTKEKDGQWRLAEVLIQDLGILERSVSSLRFECRELERAFGDLAETIASAGSS